jgi:uncharacterized glyoxalase superfamily protein PhnB
MDSLSPNIFVKDMPATIAFYQLLGFELTMTVPAEPGAELVWAMMTGGTVSFMFQTFDSLGDTLPQISRKDGGSLLLYINLKNIRAFFEKVKGSATVVAGLEKTFYGATEFSILDNNNYVLTFAEHGAE